ncbi:hypothetical protein C1H46_003635 [Malus baccata]|uniref:Uncharacterized protein n=1 Tax=Malus baccata TaxID=106549 RepID=A0A540NI55_MALBA|nr:hypothetical protein C1H46_003635 [Malus baccata]
MHLLRRGTSTCWCLRPSRPESENLGLGFRDFPFQNVKPDKERKRERLRESVENHHAPRTTTIDYVYVMEKLASLLSGIRLGSLLSSPPSFRLLPTLTDLLLPRFHRFQPRQPLHIGISADFQ